MPLSTPKNIKLKERLANHMNPKEKGELYLANYYQSGTEFNRQKGGFKKRQVG